MTKTTRWGWTFGLVALACLIGCDEGSDDKTDAKPDKTEEKSSKKDGDTKSVKEEVAEESGEEAAPEEVEPPPAVEPGKEATPFIGKKSKAPSTAEWDAQTKEVTVHGSSARMCETKMVREWLRISCRGEPEGYGKAQTVTVLSGGGKGDDFVFSSAGVASLIVRFVPGVDMKARFGWEKKSSTIHIYWPRGAPETAYKGKFSDG